MKEYFISLFRYENWANKEITNLLISINDLPEKPLLLMSHIINAQILWLSRIKNEPCDVAVWQIYDKSEISKDVNKSSSNLNEFINSITENALKEIINYTNTKGEKFSSPMEDILTHLTHHSAYHRGQIVLLIKPLVPVLPYTDYIHFVRSIKNKQNDLNY